MHITLYVFISRTSLVMTLCCAEIQTDHISGNDALRVMTSTVVGNRRIRLWQKLQKICKVDMLGTSVCIKMIKTVKLCVFLVYLFTQVFFTNIKKFATVFLRRCSTLHMCLLVKQTFRREYNIVWLKYAKHYLCYHFSRTFIFSNSYSNEIIKNTNILDKLYEIQPYIFYFS